MKLDEVLGLPKSGVIILKKHGRVLVTYTTSMGAYLETLYQEFKGKTGMEIEVRSPGAYLETLYQEFKGKTGMEIEVRSPGADLETLKLHTEYYRDLYAKEGKLLQYHIRKAIKYRIRSVPNANFKKFHVEIVNMRGEGLVVGIFKSAKESKEFIETYYGTDNSFVFPVYAVNSDTKEFLHQLQKKMLDIK